jgi:hypothetical protein
MANRPPRPSSIDRAWGRAPGALTQTVRRPVQRRPWSTRQNLAAFATPIAGQTWGTFDGASLVQNFENLNPAPGQGHLGASPPLSTKSNLLRNVKVKAQIEKPLRKEIVE